jgi:hypothetical protein
MRLARGRRELGVKPGDTVTLMLDNGADAVFIWHAITQIDAIAVAINTAWKGDLLRHVEMPLLLCTLGGLHRAPREDGKQCSEYPARGSQRSERGQRGPKLYSPRLHAPEVECIGKGKAHERYESASRSALPPLSSTARAASSSPMCGRCREVLMTAIRWLR